LEFERKRRKFYRKAFTFTSSATTSGSLPSGRGYRENGQRVKTLSIPCENTAMGGEKNLGIWIYSEIEEGFARRSWRKPPGFLCNDPSQRERNAGEGALRKGFR